MRIVVERRFVGLRKPTEEELFEERDARMRSEYFDPIERFPEKIDQLLNAINQVSFLLSNRCCNACDFLDLHGTACRNLANGEDDI